MKRKGERKWGEGKKKKWNHYTEHIDTNLGVSMFSIIPL